MSKLKSIKMTNDFSILSSEIFYFKLVYEQRGINGAARKIGQDPANISRMIQKLEATLGSKLFVRHKTGLNATEVGQRFYMAIFGAQTEFINILNSFDSNFRRIRIGFSPTIGYAHFSSKMINSLVKNKFVPEFTIASSAELLELMKSRELDFALVYNTIKFPGVISKKVANENLVLCSKAATIQSTLLIHPDMLGLEKIVQSISYNQRWMVKDYFVIAQMLSSNDSLMGIVPQSLTKTHPDIKVLRTFQGLGKITALSYPGSVGLELLR